MTETIVDPAARPPSTTELAASPRAVRRRRWAGAALLALALLLYAVTLDNGLQPEELIGGDLITHQYAQVQARPSNAPGYPLYTLGGWLWFHTLRPLAALAATDAPNPIPILSSYSTLWALLALGLLYAILNHLTRSPLHPAGNWPLAWLLSAFYAVTYFFWYYATTTEQYTSAIAQTLAIVYVYLKWRVARGEGRDSSTELSMVNDPIDEGRESQSLTINNQQLTINNSQFPTDRLPSPLAPRPSFLLILLAFLCGLSLAHMLTVAFIVPPLVIAIVWEEPRVLRNWRLMLAVVVAALLPLLSYVYVYARGAAHPEWWGAGEWTSAGEWFWSFVSTSQGRDELARGFQATCAFFDGGFPALIWGELSIPLLVVGLIGIARLGRKPAFVLYATLLIYLVFDWMYRCGNWYQVILPAYPLILMGVAAAADWWEARFMPRRWLAYAPLALLVVAIAWRFDASWPRANSNNRPEDTGLDRAAILLDQPLPPGAGLFAPVADALALDYLINIWGIRPDLRVVSSSDAGSLLDRDGMVLATLDAAPILLGEVQSTNTPIRSPFGADWLALASRHLAQPATPQGTVDAALGEGLTLVAYAVDPAPAGAPVTEAERAVDVTLFWQLRDGWPAGYGISLRPTAGGAFLPDAATGGVIQRDAAAPVQGLGQPPVDGMLADAHRIPMPDGADGVMLIVYRATDGGFENLLELPLDVPPLP